MKRTAEQQKIYERITKPLAGRTFLWTPFLRVQSEKANASRRWKSEIRWAHWHADWHLIGVELRIFGGVYRIDWVSDPSYFLNKSRWRL
jgi:hypothetical protein